MSGFLTLKDVLLPPPLPALVSILLVAGCFEISNFALRRVQANVSVVRKVAAYILAMALAGAIVHGLAMVHVASLAVLRGIAILIAIPGVFALMRCRPEAASLASALRCYWREGGLLERAALIAAGTTMAALFLTACGPVTDIDSLDYHLGVPLDWLRHHGVTLQPAWSHARLIGLGEAINMLGLAAGTDGLGAMVQVSGLVGLLFAFGSLTKTARGRAFACLIALPPVVLQLATAQKPQLFPVVAIAIAIILTLSADSKLDFMLAFACAAFAMACKYSFCFSGAAVYVLALFRARQRKQLPVALLSGVGFFVLLAGPVLLRNYHLYGDPVSPFLESLRQHPDADTVSFAQYLTDAGQPHTIGGFATLLLRSFVPSGPGDAGTVLGIGALAAFCGAGAAWLRPLLLCSVAVLMLVLWRGQLVPRFLLEPYLWCSVAAVLAPWSRAKELLFRGLVIQSCAVGAAALVGAALIFPGALTAGLRERVMLATTSGYAQAVWMDRVIPRDRPIIVESRAYALFPRPFVVAPCDGCADPVYFQTAAKEWQGRTGVAVLEYPFDEKAPGNCRMTSLAGPETFRYATRNPANRSEYQAVALDVDCR